MKTRSPDQQRTDAAAAGQNDARDAPDEGRSAERARQDDVIEQAASQESWIAQLLRTFKLSKGRPSRSGGDRNA